MNVFGKIWTAMARMFGPPHRDGRHGYPGLSDPSSFSAALIALGAKMAKSDGQVTVDEVAAFKRVFQADSRDVREIGRLFDLARQTTLGYRRYAQIIARRFRAQPAVLEDVIDGLFHIALADGIVSDQELEFLKNVSEIFGFSEQEFERIRIGHMGRAADDPYLILGVDDDISDDNLKLAYRRMATANHPDRLMARGLPPEMLGLATQKMALINKAYAEIRNRRHGPDVRS